MSPLPERRRPAKPIGMKTKAAPRKRAAKKTAEVSAPVEGAEAEAEAEAPAPAKKTTRKKASS